MLKGAWEFTHAFFFWLCLTSVDILSTIFPILASGLELGAQRGDESLKAQRSKLKAKQSDSL